MTGDPLRPVAVGEALSDRIESAGQWNAMLGPLRRLREGGRGGGEPDPRGLTPQLEVLVKNDSGGNLDRGAIVRPVGVEVSPLDHPYPFNRRPAITVDTPAAASDQPFVLLEAIPDGEFGRAAVAGVVAATVNVTTTGGEYAVPISGDSSKFATGIVGPGRILWREAGSSGDKAAAVLLADSAPTSGVHVVRSTSQTIPNITLTAIAYDGESFDIGDYHSTSVNTTRLTAPVNGLYLVGGFVNWGSSATGYREVRLRHYGVGLVFGIASQGPTTVTWQNVVGMHTFAAGQYAQFELYQDTGGDHSILAGATAWMVRLG